MNYWMGSAAALMAATLGLHVIGGTPEVMAPLDAEALPELLAAFTWVFWHFISFWLFASTLALGWLSMRANRPLAAFVATLHLGAAAIFLWVGIDQLGTPMLMLQWVIFLAIPAVMVPGIRANRPAV